MMISAAISAAGALASSAMNIASSKKAKKNAKKLYAAQSKLIDAKRATATQRYEFNQEEIVKTFQENYKRTAYAYGEKIRDLVGEKAKVASEISSTATANLSNVDLQGSSFYNSQVMELNQEFQQATNTLLYNQAQTLTDMAKEKESALTQNHLGMIDTDKNLQMEKWQAKNDMDSSIKYQTSRMISGLAPLYKNAKTFGSEAKSLYNTAKNTENFSFSSLFTSTGGK